MILAFILSSSYFRVIYVVLVFFIERKKGAKMSKKKIDTVGGLQSRNARIACANESTLLIKLN